MKLHYLIFLLLIIPLVFAESDLIKKGWFRTEDSIVVDDISATIYVSEQDRILLKFDTQISTITAGKCLSIDNIEICLIEVTDGDDRRAYIEIYKEEPDLKITRKFNKTSFFIGEEIDVEVVLENQGEEEAKNILYEDIFPEEIYIIDTSSPAYSKDNSVLWQGDLEVGEKETFEYTIQTDSEIDTYQRAQVTVNDESIFSKRIRLRSKSCYEFESELNTTNTSIGNMISLNLTLTNKFDDEVTIDSLDIEFPIGLDVKGIKKKGDVYSWSTTLTEGDTDTLEIEIMPWYSYVLEFPIKIKATCNDISYEQEFSEFFEIRKAKLVLRTNIDDINQTDEEEHELEKDANQREELIIRVQKPNPRLYFKDVHITAETNMEFEDGKKNLSALIQRLDAEDNVDAISTELITPDVKTEKKFYMKLSATYITPYGQTLNQVKDYEITVSPIEALKVTHEFGKTTIDEGDTNNVTVKIKNIRAVDLKQVYAQDFLIFNNTRTKVKSRVLDLDEGQTRTAYEYQVTAPKVAKKTPMTIETVVEYTYEGNKYTFTKQRSFSIEPKKLKLEVEPKISGDSYLGQPFDLEYIVKNEEDEEPIYNITLQWPLQTEFDLIGKETYFIEKLNPDEEIRLRAVGKLRPKIKGFVEIRPFTIFYHDSDGNKFNTTSETEKDEVKPGYFIGPAVFATKTLSKTEVNQSELFTVFIDVENKGETTAVVAVIDDLKEWDINVMPNEKRQLSRRLILEKPGRQEIGAAIIKYQGINETYTTVSNSPIINVRAIAEEEEVPKEVPILVLAEEKIKLHPFISLVALALVILIIVVGYIYIRETFLIKKPLIYSEQEKMWKRY